MQFFISIRRIREGNRLRAVAVLEILVGATHEKHLTLSQGLRRAACIRLINYLVRLAPCSGLQLLKSTFFITVMRLIGSWTFHKWCAILSIFGFGFVRPGIFTRSAISRYPYSIQSILLAWIQKTHVSDDRSRRWRQ
jgi:hypothetical protein